MTAQASNSCWALSFFLLFFFFLFFFFFSFSFLLLSRCFTSTETVWLIRDGEIGNDSPGRPPCSHSSWTLSSVYFFFHGALRPQKPYGLLGTGGKGMRHIGNESPGPPQLLSSEVGYKRSKLRRLYYNNSLLLKLSPCRQVSVLALRLISHRFSPFNRLFVFCLFVVVVVFSFIKGLPRKFACCVLS